MGINYNPNLPPNDAPTPGQQVTHEGAELVSKVPYGGQDEYDPDYDFSDPNDDGFIDGLFTAFGLGGGNRG